MPRRISDARTGFLSLFKNLLCGSGSDKSKLEASTNQDFAQGHSSFSGERQEVSVIPVIFGYNGGRQWGAIRFFSNLIAVLQRL